jgi:DNA-binding NtrC family response regulator
MENTWHWWRAMTKVLVVDNDPLVCDLVADLMEVDLAAEVKRAMTGTLAAEAIDGGAFDLAIIDVFMPEISGLELAARAANRNIPSLLCTGHPDALAQLQEHDYPHLAKPFRVADLVHEAAKAITAAAENIARVKASAAKMLATAKGLQGAIDESRRLINESKALLADRPPPEPVIPLDVIDDWLASLASRPKPG